MAAGDPLLTLTKVDKHFGGLHVINNLDFEVREEEIVGLIGPNGAGKSTVFNLITSIYPIDSGSIRFKDKEIAGLAPHKICHLGIARTYQLVRAFLKMSVFDNVMTAAVYGGKHPQSPKQRTLESLELVGLSGKRDIKAAHLTLSDRRLLEIAMAMASMPSLILLDEPMAGLTSIEIEQPARGHQDDERRTEVRDPLDRAQGRRGARLLRPGRRARLWGQDRGRLPRRRGVRPQSDRGVSWRTRCLRSKI